MKKGQIYINEIIPYMTLLMSFSVIYFARFLFPFSLLLFAAPAASFLITSKGRPSREHASYLLLLAFLGLYVIYFFNGAVVVRAASGGGGGGGGCVPDCDGVGCGGSDGCGGTCLNCAIGTCIRAKGVWKCISCTPDDIATTCLGKNCGDVVNNCGQLVSCGTCTSDVCYNNQCCTLNCAGKTCGASDSCGGICTSCVSGTCTNVNNVWQCCDSPATTCASGLCGQTTNNCGQPVTCVCSSGVCSSNHCCPDGQVWTGAHCCPTGQEWNDYANSCVPSGCAVGESCDDSNTCTVYETWHLVNGKCKCIGGVNPCPVKTACDGTVLIQYTDLCFEVGNDHVCAIKSIGDCANPVDACWTGGICTDSGGPGGGNCTGYQPKCTGSDKCINFGNGAAQCCPADKPCWDSKNSKCSECCTCNGYMCGEVNECGITCSGPCPASPAWPVTPACSGAPYYQCCGTGVAVEGGCCVISPDLTPEQKAVFPCGQTWPGIPDNQCGVAGPGCPSYTGTYCPAGTCQSGKCVCSNDFTYFDNKCVCTGTVNQFSGKCELLPSGCNKGDSCDDHNGCTTGTTYQTAGDCNSCGGGTPVTCNDHETCTSSSGPYIRYTSGSCVPSTVDDTHTCSYSIASTDCNDRNACTTDSCVDSGCVYSLPRTCIPSNAAACIDYGTCNSATGLCPAKTDNCVTGRCNYATGNCEPITGPCTPNPCTSPPAGGTCNNNMFTRKGLPGTCEVISGAPSCTYTDVTTNCVDTDLCTIDSCSPALGCTNAPKTCTASDLCHVAGCQASTGNCGQTPKQCSLGEECDLNDGGCKPTGQLDVKCSPAQSTVLVGQSQTFSSLVTNGASPFLYSWSAPLSTNPAGTQPTHTTSYLSANSYIATVAVMDSASATSTDGCSVNVENAGTIAGKIFVDANCNRELDANEVYIEDPSGPPTCPYQQVQDGFSVSYSSIAKTGSTIPNECDANGPFYFAIVPPSTYTINLNMPAGWQNTTRTSVTEVLNTGGSLLKTFGVRQCTPLSFNPLTSFVSNLRPDPGEHYLAYCDYGVRTDSIVIADPNCVWTGYPHTDNNGWLGTAKEFNCTAPFARGTYDVVCTVEICTPSNNCARSDKAGSIIVAPGCGNGVVDPGEECDDGNLVGDDLCRNDCKLNVLVSKSVIVDFNGMSNVSDPLWVQAKKVAYPSGPQASGWIAQNLDPEITEYEDYPQILTATGWNRLLMDYHIFNSNSFGFMLPNNATYNVTFIAGGRLSGKTHTGMVHVKIQDSNGVSGQTDLDTVPDGKIKYFTVSDVALQDYAVFNLTKYDPSDVAVITGIILQCTETSPPLPDFDNNCDKNYIISGVNITGISVSPNPSGRAATVNISCGSSVADVDCIDAYLDSGMCTFDSWHGDNANFTCLASTTCPARQIAKCSVNETKCKRGSTNNMSSLLNVICGPCGYIDQATCETDNACSWNPMCQGTKYLSSADPDGICVTKRTSTYSCKAGKCGAECDPATSCPDFRISIETSGRKCYYGTGICNGNCGCDYSSSCILNVNERCDRNMGCVIDNSLNLSMHVNVTAVPKRPSLGETVNVSVKGKILDINGSRVTVVAKCGQSQTLDLVPCTMAELMFDKGLEGREVNLLTSHKPPGQFIQPQPYNVASPENFDTSGKQWIIYLGSFDYRNSNVSACLGYQGITGCGNDTYNVQSVGMNIDVKYPDVEGQIIPVTATGAPNFTRGMKINFIVNARTTNIGLGYDCNSNAACDVTYNISDGSGEPFYSTPAFWDGFIKGYRGQEPSTGLDCNRYYKLNVRAYVKDGPYKDTEGTESFDIYMSCAPAVTVSPAEARTYLGQANTKVFDVTFWNPLTTPMNDLQLRMDSEDAQEYPVNWLHFDSGGVNLGKIIDHFSVSGLSSRTYSVVLEEAGRSGKYTAVFTVSDNPQQVIVAKNSGRLYIFAEGLPEFAFWQLLVAFVIAGAIIFIKKDYAAGARKSAGRVVNKVAL